SLNINAGGSQTASVGQTLPNPIVVTVTDKLKGAPVAGQLVNWVITQGGGSMYVEATQTDNHGQTRNWWTMGPTAGIQTVEVRAVDPTTGDRLVYGTVNATATSTQNTLTVTEAGTGSGTVTSSPAGINCGSACAANFDAGTIVTLTASPAAGSSFSGWSGGGCSGTGTCAVTVTAATSVTSTFALTPTQFHLTVATTGNGSGTVTSTDARINCGSTCASDYDAGTVVTLNATPGAGSSFIGWAGGGCSGTGACTVTMAAATTVTAVFTLQQFNLVLATTRTGTGAGTVTSTDGRINCGSTCTSSDYTYGTVVTLTAMSGAGSSFAGWSGGGCSGTGICTVTITGSTTVTANFTLSEFALNNIEKERDQARSATPR
ncbi:MAG TPA: hypothetical protein VGI97_01465, partial [Gemmatimonadaceae bacterium]